MGNWGWLGVGVCLMIVACDEEAVITGGSSSSRSDAGSAGSGGESGEGGMGGGGGNTCASAGCGTGSAVVNGGAGGSNGSGGATSGFGAEAGLGGESGAPAGGDASCPAITPNACGEACVDLSADSQHCGACGATCSDAEVCVRGECVLACAEGTTLCSEACVSLQSDELHCGTCGTECGVCESCIAGTCRTRVTWDPGEALYVGPETSAMIPRLAVAGSAQVFALWKENLIDTENEWETDEIFASQFDSEALVWAPPVSLLEDREEWPFARYGLLTPGELVGSSNGDVVATVKESDYDDSASTVGYSAWVLRFDAETGTWDEPVDVTQGYAEGGGVPAVSVDDSGNTCVVWHQSFNGVTHVWSIRYDASLAAWQPAALLATIPGRGRSADVTVQPQGDFLAAWVDDGKPSGSYYDADTDSWSSPFQLVDAESVVALQIASDAAGNAHMVWSPSDPTSLWASRSIGGFVWDAPQLVTSEADAGACELAVTRRGHAMLTWGDAGRYWSSRYEATEHSWDPPELAAESAAQTSIQADLALDEDGDGIIVWAEDADLGAPVSVTRYCARTDAWGPSEVLAEAGGAPAATIAGTGHAFAAWIQQQPDTPDAWVRRVAP